MESIDAKLKQIMEYTELSRNMVQGCENYLEKYQPLFTHRQISEALDHVNTSVKLKWRLKKFSENKATLLIDRILQDKGQPDLAGTVERVRSGLKAGGTGLDEADGPAERGAGSRADGSKDETHPSRLSGAPANLGGQGGDHDMSDDEDEPSSKPPATSAA